MPSIKSLFSFALLTASAMAITSSPISLRRSQEVDQLHGRSDPKAPVKLATPSLPAPCGQAGSGVWCVAILGDPSTYTFVEKTFDKQTPLPGGQGVVYQYSVGKTDSFNLKNGDSTVSWLTSGIASTAMTMPWTKGPKTYASFTTLDTNMDTNANGVSGPHQIFSPFTYGDNLFIVIPKA